MTSPDSTVEAAVLSGPEPGAGDGSSAGEPAAAARESENEREASPSTETQPSLHGWILAGAVTVGLLAVAYLAQTILIPIVGALLLSATLSPILRWLKRRGVPRYLGAIAFASILSVLSVFTLVALGSVLGEWVNDAPAMIGKLEDRLVTLLEPLNEISEATEKIGKPKQKEDSSNGPASGNGGLAAPGSAEENAPARDPFSPPTVGDGGVAAALITTVLGMSISVLVGLMICLVLTLFLLWSGDVFLAKLLSLFRTLGDKKEAMTIVREIERDVSHFLGIWTLINMGVGAVVWGAFHLLGVPDAWLWGIVAMLFNYVPYAGPWTLGALALVMGFIRFDELGWAVAPAAVILLVNVVEGFVISPMVHGRGLKLNTVAVFLSIIVGGWLWGVAGALMAVPLLVVVYVISSHAPPLQTLALFLDDRAPGLTRDRDRGDISSGATPPVKNEG